ncbi:MAG: MarR family transcriptional regulator, partial [Nitrosopumilus sp.]
MNPEIVPIHRKEFLREDGMLFVRTEGIVDTMVKIPLLVASMIIVAAVMPIQSSFSSPRTLDLIIYPDGSTHVSTEIDVDPLAINYELDLFGSTIDNLVAVGENDFLLDTTVIDDSALIETFGSSVISVEYDIH